MESSHPRKKEAGFMSSLLWLPPLLLPSYASGPSPSPSSLALSNRIANSHAHDHNKANHQHHHHHHDTDKTSSSSSWLSRWWHLPRGKGRGEHTDQHQQQKSDALAAAIANNVNPLSSIASGAGSSSSTSDDSSSSDVGRKTRETNAVNRKWSDVDPFTLIGTFGLTSFLSSVLLHPAYLIVARQQCQHDEQKMAGIVKSILKKHGVLGLYRGVVISTAGTVMSECVYFAVLEKAKEALPFSSQEQRTFGAGLAADGISGPLYVPFAILSQKQMVGDVMVEAAVTTTSASSSSSSASAPSSSNNNTRASFTCSAITRDIVRREGIAGMFRGTFISLAMMPISGCWWVLYEYLKGRAYGAIAGGEHLLSAWWVPSARASGKGEGHSGHTFAEGGWRGLITSTTDNPLVNASVGAVTGGIMSAVLNPMYVVRTRLQVLDVPPPPPPTSSSGAASSSAASTASSSSSPPKLRAVAVARDVYRREGLRGFARGLRVNMLMGIGGSMLFGTFYEGAKRVADTTG